MNWNTPSANNNVDPHHTENTTGQPGTFDFPSAWKLLLDFVMFLFPFKLLSFFHNGLFMANTNTGKLSLLL